MKIHCGARLGIGDELMFTALAREYKRAFPTEEIQIYASQRDWLWKGNPHVGHGTTNNGKEIRPNVFGWLKASTAHAFARSLGFQIVDDTPEIWLTQEEREKDFGISNWDRTVAIDIQASWESRQWESTRFIRTAELLRDDGWRVIRVGRHDKNSAVASVNLPYDYSFVNELTPRENCAMLSNVSLFLGNDSGNFHMAAAVGAPQVVIFGSIPWYARAYWNTTSVFAYSDCNPHCMEVCIRQDPIPFGPKSHCLTEIQPERVAEAARVAYNRFVEPGLRIHRPRAGRSRPLVPFGTQPVEW